MAFAGAVIECERPTLPYGTSGHDLHPDYSTSFREEELHFPQMIHYWASCLENPHTGLNYSQNFQKYCSELQVWSKYANIFYSTYPLILHDRKAALQTLAIKAPSSFWYYFWMWNSFCEDQRRELYEPIEYLCGNVVPELFSIPLQRQA